MQALTKHLAGGGVIGCSIAYFLTHHELFDTKLHSVTILEASSIAGGASGKAGGLLADWATPECLAPLSFRTHAELAKSHGGDKIWGYRAVYCADVKLQAQSSDATRSSHDQSIPEELDWLSPGTIKSYKEVGSPENSAQVNPYMFTRTMASLAQEKGANIVYGSASHLEYNANGKKIASVAYIQNGESQSLAATDVVMAAGPWTSRLVPSIHLEAPRGHSVVVQPSRSLTPHVLFPEILPPEDGSLPDILSPEVYPRPPDNLFAYDTVYASGPDDYEADLPEDTRNVEIDAQKCEKVLNAIKSISGLIRDGEVITKQACYKPQIRQHEEDEEVGPIVGPAGVEGLWIATGHDEWGIQHAAGTGLVMSEMIFEGEAKSADCESLHPKHFLKDAAVGGTVGTQLPR